MYAVIEYYNYHKSQNFSIKLTTDDVEYAKKIAFNYAKENMPTNTTSIFKITTKIDNNFLHQLNKTIVQYMIIEVQNYKNGFKLQTPLSKIYSVVELDKHNKLENLKEIDESLICNNYYGYYDYDYN